jgi:hypothetical protein
MKSFLSIRAMVLLSLRHAGAFVGAGKEPSCCGFATAGAETQKIVMDII